MAREKPLDVAVVQAWQAAWSETEIFSDAAVRHLQSFIPDPLCLVVVTLGVGREPRSLVFRRIKRVVPVPGALESNPKSALKRVEDLFVNRGDIGPLASMFVGPIAPAVPPVDQLWHQTGVKSEKSEGARRLERLL